MKIKILIIVIPLLLVLQIQNELLAQGAKSKKPGSTDKNGNERVNTEESVENNIKTESSTENYDVDQTEKNTKNYSNGEPIELYDLVYILLPDEGETAQEVDWKKLDDINNLKLEDKYYDKFSNRSSQYGNAIIMVNGRIFDGNDWSVDFEGYENGWSIFDLSYVFNIFSVDFDTEFYFDLKNLFLSSNFKSKLISEDDYYGYLYEVKLPNKRSCWMQIKQVGNKIPDFRLSFFLNEKEVNKNRY